VLKVMESCWWPGNEATCLVFNFVLSRKSPTNLVVHVHVCDVGVEKGRRGGGGRDPHHSLPCIWTWMMSHNLLGSH